MLLYILIYIVLLFFSYIELRSHYVIIIWGVLFSLLVGFRAEEVGTDTISYMMMYDELSDGYSGYPEPLFGLYGALCNKLGFSFQIFQTLIFFFAFYFTIVIVKRRSPNYGFSIFFLFSCYFLFYSLNIYRQMLACFMSVYICNLYFEKKCHIVTYLFLVGLITLIHYTALLLVPVIFINKLKMKSNVVVLSLVISLILGIIDMSNILMPIIGKYERLMMNDLYIRSIEKLIIGVLLSLYWTALFLFLYKKSSKEFRESYYMKFFLCGLVIYNLLIRQDMGLRVLLYFTIHLSIALPLFIQLNLKKRLFYKHLLIAYCSIYLFVFLLMNSADVVPYMINW